jgi:putative phage-type endonuclease
MRYVDGEQGSIEWLQARCGTPTASNFSKILTTSLKKSTQKEGYLNQLIAEKITGEPQMLFKSAAMEMGNELEPVAKAYYELQNDIEVVETGLLLHDTLQAGGSPDGLVGQDGGLEIKCPLGSTHIENLRKQKVPSQYMTQIQGCLWVTEREWWDFMSFHPLIEPMIIRVYRDEDYIKALEEELTEFCAIIESESNKWQRK